MTTNRDVGYNFGGVEGDFDGEKVFRVGGRGGEDEVSTAALLVDHLQTPEQTASPRLELVAAVYLRHHRGTRVRPTVSQGSAQTHSLMEPFQYPPPPPHTHTETRDVQFNDPK